MPIIRIELSAGRTRQQKLSVAEDVTRSMVEHCSCKPETIHVIFNDVDPADWAVAGRLLDHPAA